MPKSGLALSVQDKKSTSGKTFIVDRLDKLQSRRPIAMNEEDRLQLERLTDRAKRKSQEQLEQGLRRIFTEHSLKGILGSNSTIKAGIQLMEKIATDWFAQLVEECGDVARTEEVFDQIAEAMSEILHKFGGKLPEIVSNAIGGQAVGSITASGLGLFRSMRSDVEAEVIMARHSFLNESTADNTFDDNRRGPVAKGGKPLAKHWDAMWAEIATQLWTGDLNPNKQADIKRAMFDWLNDRGINAGDTSVTERARALWLRMERDKD